MFHNVTEDDIAFMITAEEFKEHLLRAEGLQQAIIQTLKTGRPLEMKALVELIMNLLLPALRCEGD